MTALVGFRCFEHQSHIMGGPNANIEGCMLKKVKPLCQSWLKKTWQIVLSLTT